MKCPKCKEDISYLNYETLQRHTGQFELDKQGFEDWDEDDYGGVLYEVIKEQYYCPDCEERIFDNLEDARLFLHSN